MNTETSSAQGSENNWLQKVRGKFSDLKGIFCYLSEIKDIPTEIEERKYRRDDGKNQTG